MLKRFYENGYSEGLKKFGLDAASAGRLLGRGVGSTLRFIGEHPILGSAAVGAVPGAIGGAMQYPDQPLEGALRGAAFGAGTGALVGAPMAMSNAVSRSLQRRMLMG
jgi:hypothetical protein